MAATPDSQDRPGEDAGPNFPRQELERWFEGHGVPHFSDRYPRRELRPLVLSILAVVLGFELTVLAWLEVTVPVALASLAYVALMVLILLPFLRKVCEPWTIDSWPFLIGTLVLRVVVFAGLGTLLWITALPDVTLENWFTFTVFVTLLLAAIALGQGRPRAGVAEYPVVETLSALLLFAALGIAWAEWDEPRGLATLVGAQIVAIGFLTFALVAIEERVADGAKRSAAPMSALLVVLAVQVTILPALAAPAVLTLVSLALTLIAIYWPALLESKAGKAVTTWLPDQARISRPVMRAVFAIVFLGSLPLFVESTHVPGPISWLEALALNTACLFLTLFFVLYGLDRIVWWMTEEAVRDFRSTLRALVGSLPIVLLLLFFVGLSAEIWQVATRPGAGSFAILIAAIVTIALVVAFWGCLRELAAYEDSLEQWPAVQAAVDDSDDDELKRLLKGHVKSEGDKPSPDLGLRPKVNVLTVMMLYQVIYCTAVGLAMTGVFYGVGLLAVDDEMLDRWQVEIPDERRAGWAVGPNEYSQWPLEDRPWTRLAVLLGAFSALAFVAHVTAGDEERRRFFEGPDKGIKARLAARIIYRDKYPKVSRARTRSRLLPGAADRDEARPAAPASG
jgi:hypothetical protein